MPARWVIKSQKEPNMRFSIILSSLLGWIGLNESLECSDIAYSEDGSRYFSFFLLENLTGEKVLRN